MSFLTLTPELVTAIHDEILNPGEMKGRAQDKSLDGALARVGNRLIYGLIIDVFDLAAAYSVAIAQGLRRPLIRLAAPAARKTSMI